MNGKSIYVRTRETCYAVCYYINQSLDINILYKFIHQAIIVMSFSQLTTHNPRILHLGKVDTMAFTDEHLYTRRLDWPVATLHPNTGIGLTVNTLECL